MRSLIGQWEERADPRAVFLSCYWMMTSNMLAAIEQKEFNDPAWVDRLLHRFADYYFVALDAYELNPASAPPVWQLAHNITSAPNSSALQKILLGVNAHINYDLVLTLVDLLQSEWDGLSEEQRLIRYADHCRVNHVIGSTIDAVQDQILEPAMPVMDLIDRLLGSLDEMLISRLITQWREQVWQNAVHLLQTNAEDERLRIIAQFEEEALKIGEVICLRDTL
jgi:hypothetical protein